MRLLKFLLVAIAFEACYALPYVDILDVPDEVIPLERANNIDYRLPENFEAIDYVLTIQPFFDIPDANKNFTFDGSLIMQLKPLKDNLNKIVLHANGLTIAQNNVIVSTGTTPINIQSIVYETVKDFMTINLASVLIKGTTYKITIKYSGIIREGMSGFYRSSYRENGTTKWLGTTQFQPVHARKVFPCLDEPQYKATFLLTIIRPKNFSPSLSNMPIDKTVEISTTETSETFFKTPKMSTYLLAFIVSEFQAASKTDDADANKFGVWARPGAKNMGKFAFDSGRLLVKEMDTFTGIEYYKMEDKMKMDQAGIPDFSAGAMENWGLLTYREAYLMYSETESSAKYRQQIIAVLAHEIAHMWFGDLVTCHWWSDTWLNEGFARYFQFKLPDQVEDLALATQFIPAQLHTAFVADTSVLSSPLTNNDINTPGEIGGHFGSISYNKGASVIKMMEHWIGPSTFQAALKSYLSTMKYKTVKPSDLFDAFQKQANIDQSLAAYNGSDVATVMSSWTSQSGYPVLHVSVDYDYTGDMNITQERMVGYGEDPLPDILYHIPITFATLNQSDFDNTKPLTIMSSKKIVLNKGKVGHEWVIFNKKQTGFYRVNYDAHSWQMLSSFLKGSSRTNIHTLNRAQVVDDILNLARENITDYKTAFNVIQFLEVESDYAPWTAAITGFSVLRRKFSVVPETLALLDKHILNLMKKVTGTLGLSVNGTESHLTKLFQANTLSFACLLGHKDCVDDSYKQFQNMRTGKSVNPNLREHVYCNGLRHGNETDFDYLWAKYLSENVINEQVVILGALGCTKHEKSLNTFLAQTMMENSPIRKQDLMTAFNSAVSGNEENVEIVFNFLKANTEDFITYYNTDLSAAMTSLIGRMKGTQLQRVQAFLRTSGFPDSVVASGISAIASAGVNWEWAMMHKDTVDSWILSKYSGASTVASSLVLMFAMFAVLFQNQ